MVVDDPLRAHYALLAIPSRLTLRVDLSSISPLFTLREGAKKFGENAETAHLGLQLYSDAPTRGARVVVMRPIRRPHLM